MQYSYAILHSLNNRRLRSKMKTSLLLALLISVSGSQKAFAWGERGHDLVTRVAVQNLRHISNDDARLVRPFARRDHMLSHLSNVPDIVWRAPYQSELVLEVNPSTHYINLEKVYENVTRYSDIPADFLQYSQDARAKGYEPNESGTAPWRVMQLYTALVEAMKQAGQAQDRKAVEKAGNEVLLLAGVMAHFVGDLSNPHHTTANHNGQLTGQGGFHSYFESQTVEEQGFDLVARIVKQAKRSWLTHYSKKERTEILADPQKLVWALVVNSNGRKEKLEAIDRRYSLLQESQGERDRAKRKPAKAMAKHYKKFTIERIGAGASALSQLWLLAWKESGEPDMSTYFSYHYHVKPDFIHPEY